MGTRMLGNPIECEQHRRQVGLSSQDVLDHKASVRIKTIQKVCKSFIGLCIWQPVRERSIARLMEDLCDAIVGFELPGDSGITRYIILSYLRKRLAKSLEHPIFRFSLVIQVAGNKHLEGIAHNVKKARLLHRIRYFQLAC